MSPRASSGLAAVLLVLLLGAPLGASEGEMGEVAQATAGSVWFRDGRIQDYCDQPIVVALAQVNQRVAVTVELLEPPTANAHVNALQGEDCRVSFTTEPGRFEDPCVMLSGGLSVPQVSPSDPYFTFEPDGFWHHRVGSADYYVMPGWRYADHLGSFGGRCRLGDVYAAWGAEWTDATILLPPGK